MRQFLSIFTCASLFLTQISANAQQSGRSICLRIDAEVNGEKLAIDTSIRSLNDLDLEPYLEGLGLSNVSHQLNIDFNSGFQGEPYFDEQAFRDMMQALQDIDMQAITPIPPVPPV